MNPILDANQAMIDAQNAFNELRHYKGTEQYKRMLTWVEALIVQQQCAMTSCGKDKLEESQVRLKQMIALRSALVDPGGAFTGFIF